MYGKTVVYDWSKLTPLTTNLAQEVTLIRLRCTLPGVRFQVLTEGLVVWVRCGCNRFQIIYVMFERELIPAWIGYTGIRMPTYNIKISTNFWISWLFSCKSVENQEPTSYPHKKCGGQQLHHTMIWQSENRGTWKKFTSKIRKRIARCSSKGVTPGIICLR